MKKIMLCLDGSTASEGGVPTCRQLAEALDAEVEIVRAVQWPRMNWGEPHSGTLTAPQFVREAFARQDSEIADRLGAIARSFPQASVRLLHGNHPAREIIREATEQHTELIVMTSHDTSNTGEIRLGSVVRDVIQSGVAPVLVVHPELAPPLRELPVGTSVVTADCHEIGELAETRGEKLRIRTASQEDLWLRGSDVDRLEIGHLVLHWDASATAERVLEGRGSR